MEKKEKVFLTLDNWQREVLEHKGNKVICSGRQTGKSTVVSILAGEFAVKTPNKHVLIVSVTEDQARELLMKVQMYIADTYPKRIRTNKSLTNKEKVTLTNGSIVRTKAVGQSGLGVRGFTIDMLIADEAAFMPEDVWPAVTPMLLTTGGDIILLSTPHGKKGYFYECYHDVENFKTFHINSVDVMTQRPISETWRQIQRDKAIGFIESERKRMSIREFGQEYLGQFIDDLAQYYPDETIRKTMIYQRQGMKPGAEYFLGVDVARMGNDKCVFAIVERKGELLIHAENIVWTKVLLSEVTDKIKQLDEQWHFRRMYIDDGGIGVGVFDSLYTTPGMKKRVVAINNAQRVYDYNPNGTPKTKKLLGEDLHNNLLHLMEKGKIVLLDDGDIWLSFKSVQYEYTNEKGGATMRIFGSDTHSVEAIKRAVWCVKEKINNFNISYM